MGDGEKSGGKDFLPGVVTNPRGRPKGAISKRTVEFMAVLEKNNFCPASAMIEIFQEASKVYKSYSVIYNAIIEAKSNDAGYAVPLEDKAPQYLKIAADMAKEISSYAYPKKRAVDITIDPQIAEQIKLLEGKSEQELLAIVNSKES